jgi:hypothetical protein
MELKDIIPNLNREVEYKGNNYIMRESIVWKDQRGDVNYSAILLDPNGNSQYRVSIKDINKKEN